MQTKGKRKRPHLHRFTELGIYVFESRHSEDFEMEMGEWDFHKLCVVLKGKGFIETKNGRIPLSPNQLLYLPAHVAHRFADERGSPLTHVMVCFYDATFGGNPPALDTLSLFRQNFPAVASFPLTDHHSRVKVKNSFKLMLFEQLQRKEGGAAAIWCGLVELLVFLTRAASEQRKLATRDPRATAFAGSLNFINNNFYRPIKIEELAALANVSYRCYTDQFKQSTGKTVTQYLSEVRVEYAKRIMLETEDILYAAYESGFGDLAHFYRVFKSITGRTPKQFITGRSALSPKT